jgi:flagellar hook-associated protein 3 FlgL
MLGHITTWQSNIGAATRSMAIAQTSLSQISSIATQFLGKMADLSALNGSEVDSIAAAARLALPEVASFLNARDGISYVFAGQQSATAPVPDAMSILSSSFYTGVAGAVGSLAGDGNATFAAALAAGAGQSPIVTAGAAQPIIQTGAGETATVGIVAGTNAWATSAGVSSTPPTSSGSYITDILTSLAIIGSLSSSAAADGGFTQLVQNTQTCLSGAITALNQDAGVLGDQQSSLSATSTVLSSFSDTLTARLSDAQDVDMTKVATELSAAQTRLQASYELISNAASLSLVKYLG